MPDIEQITQENEIQEPDYVAQITELRANTVSKDKYERLAADNKRLMDALVKGEQIELPKEESVDKDALRKSLYTDEVQKLNDIDFVKNTLALRKAIMDEGGEDPFLPFGHRSAPEDSDYATAEKVADVLQQCVEYADGDNAVFLNELQRRTMDISPISTKAKGRRR